MSSLKRNLIRQRKKAARKEFEGIKSILKNEEKIKFYFFLLVSIIVYLIAITILYKKEKITWHENKLLLDRWAYVSLSVITFLTIFFFFVILLETFESKHEPFFEAMKETKEKMKWIIKEIEKTNPEILERLEKLEEMEEERKELEEINLF